MMLFNIIAVLTLSILQEGYAVPCTYPGLTMCDCIGTVIKCLEQNLTQIPSTIPKNTTGLPFQKNKISVIDDTSLSGLTSLKELILSYNDISIIEDGAFSDLQALKRLFLVSNKIDSLGTKLSGLTSLQNLDLSLNDISNIKDGEFSGLQSLETIGISSNKISSIEDGAFSGLPSLRILAIDNNNLTTVSGNIFDKVTDLRKLILRGNPLLCCTMIDFFEWLPNQKNITFYDGTCTDFNSTTDINSFNVSKCPIDGGWSSWVNSTCSVTCGNGILSRKRTCDSPIPSVGGKNCEGSNEESVECSLTNCQELCKESGKKSESKRLKARKWKRYLYRQLNRRGATRNH